MAALDNEAIRVMRDVESVCDTFLSLFDQTAAKVDQWADDHSFDQDRRWPVLPQQKRANWHKWWYTLQPPQEVGWHPSCCSSGTCGRGRRVNTRVSIDLPQAWWSTTRHWSPEDVWDNTYADSLTGFEFERLDGTDRLCRCWDLEDLLDGDIKAQADANYRFIKDSFEARISAGHPHVDG